MTNISKASKIYIAGHNGMVGSALWRLFKGKGYLNLIGIDSNDLDSISSLESLDSERA